MLRLPSSVLSGFRARSHREARQTCPVQAPCAPRTRGRVSSSHTTRHLDSASFVVRCSVAGDSEGTERAAIGRRDVLTATVLAAAVPGVAQRATAAEAPSDRIADIIKAIDDLERKGGGTFVPDFAPGLTWMNAPPLSLKRELRGRIVVLDFWTYCCINCMHVLPELANLEKKWADYPITVVGVHSAKFDNEKDTESIRQAVLRYGVTHPVVNDPAMKLWGELRVQSWPTLVVVSPEGKVITYLAGENHEKDLDDVFTAALKYYGDKGVLVPGRVPVSLERDKDARAAASPLSYPGKVAIDAEGKTLFVSDSGNNRIVATDLQGKFLFSVGSGAVGLRDGPAAEAQFNRPQGVAVDSARGLLYVADTENHALRVVNLKTKTVSTLAGTGVKGRDYRGGGAGSRQLLNSPWDVAVTAAGDVFVAMAGQHQIWRYEVASGTTSMVSGNGYERNANGPTGNLTSWAQPSGLSLDASGKRLFVADSESSSVREMDTETFGGKLLAGGDGRVSDNLFRFGDKDGRGQEVLLQHPLGVAVSADGSVVFVADSYNHKIKALKPETGEVTTLAGLGRAGFKDGKGGAAAFSEPGGLAVAPNGDVIIADTNNGAIRVFHPATGVVDTLDMSSVPKADTGASAAADAEQQQASQAPAGAAVVRASPTSAQKVEISLDIRLPAGYHYTKGAGSGYAVTVEPQGAAKLVSPAKGPLSERGVAAKVALQRQPGASGVVRVACKVYYCEEESLCLFKQVVFEVPLADSAPAVAAVAMRYDVPLAGAGVPGGAGGFGLSSSSSSSSSSRVPSLA